MTDEDIFLEHRPTVTVDKLVTWLTSVKDKTWLWVRNTRCKYVILKIDTRSGAYAILDRDDLAITEQELFYQYSSDKTLTPVNDRWLNTIDERALKIAQKIAQESNITDPQTIARIQLGATEGLKQVSYSNTISVLSKALNSARGWVLTCIESPTAKKDLRLIDDALDLAGADIACTCLSASQDDAYDPGGPMSGKKRPPACRATVHKER